MKIPFMRVDRQFAGLRGEVMPRVETILETGRVLQSPDISKLEERLATLHGLSQGVATNSGTDALMFAIAGLGLPPGSRIAVTAMTFIASASAIVHNGHRPVFIDVDPETMLMDTAPVLELIRKKQVAAVVLVHLYGQLLDLEEIAREARTHGVRLIEDGAQSIGATRNGRPPGGHGDVLCLSFDPTKVVGAAGSGGALVTSDARIAETARLLRYHGHAGNRVYTVPGYNCQMDSLQAAIIDVKLNHAATWQEQRTKVAESFTAGLAGVDGIRQLGTLPGNVHNFHKYVLRCERRDELAKHLADRGVATSIHYSLPLHRQPCFAPHVEPGLSLPRVERAAGEILSLPMYAELTAEEIAHVVGATREFYGN